MQKKDCIHFFRNNEIDKQRWNECIEASPNGLIYARSFYLDNICPGWCAVAGENYEWVLPITSKTKFGIAYLYQPPFTQQLGVFSKADIIVPYQEIIEWLRQRYKFWEINWNYSTNDKIFNSSIQIFSANNFILDLSHKYESISSNYHNVLIKNIKRSKHFNPVYKKTEDFNVCIHLYKEYYGSRISHVNPTDYKKFLNICYHASEHQMLQCRQVLDNEDKLLAAALLLYDGKRLYNLMNVTTEAGRKKQANHFLLDKIIREFSGQKLLFDFEGSDLPGVKTFYENFGAVNQPYLMLRYNKLP